MIIESPLGVAPFMGMRPCCGCYAYMMVANRVISDDSSTIEPGSLARPQYAATAPINPFVHHLSRQRDEGSARDSWERGASL